MVIAWISEHRRFIEVIGLAILFAASGWELFIEKGAERLGADGKFLAMDAQLFAIWNALGQRDPTGYVSTNYEAFVERRKWFDATPFQAKLLRKIRFVLFAVGSVLVIVARAV